MITPHITNWNIYMENQWSIRIYVYIHIWEWVSGVHISIGNSRPIKIEEEERGGVFFNIFFFCRIHDRIFGICLLIGLKRDILYFNIRCMEHGITLFRYHCKISTTTLTHCCCCCFLLHYTLSPIEKMDRFFTKKIIKIKNKLQIKRVIYVNISRNTTSC